MNASTEHVVGASPSEIEAAVAAMLLKALPMESYSWLAHYVRLLSLWNQKMNLTAVRDPRVFVRLHLAECLRAAQTIPPGVKTVLDFGSGAGLPGIPIQIARPELQVTLAESQKKKAAFLREVVREMRLSNATVYAGRVEDLPVSAVFDLVTLRAVDKMSEALQSAYPRLRPQGESVGGRCMVLSSRSEVTAVEASIPSEMQWMPPEDIPGTNQRVILIGSRI